MANHHSIEPQQTTNTSRQSFLSDTMLPLCHPLSLRQSAYQGDIKDEFAAFKNVCEAVTKNTSMCSASIIASLLSTAEAIYINAFAHQDSDAISQIHHQLTQLLTKFFEQDNKKLPIDLFIKLFLFASLASYDSLGVEETARRQLMYLLNSKLGDALPKPNASNKEEQMLALGDALIHLNVVLYHPLTSLKNNNTTRTVIERCSILLEEICFRQILLLKTVKGKENISLVLAKLSSFFLTHMTHLGNLSLNKLTKIFDCLFSPTLGFNINGIKGSASLLLQIETFNIELFQEDEISDIQNNYLHKTFTVSKHIRNDSFLSLVIAVWQARLLPESKRLAEYTSIYEKHTPNFIEQELRQEQHEFIISFYYSYCHLLQQLKTAAIENQSISICTLAMINFQMIRKGFDTQQPKDKPSPVLNKLYYLQQVRLDNFNNMKEESGFTKKDIIQSKIFAIVNMGFFLCRNLLDNYKSSKEELIDFLLTSYEGMKCLEQLKKNHDVDIKENIRKNALQAFKVLVKDFELSSAEIALHYKKISVFCDDKENREYFIQKAEKHRLNPCAHSDTEDSSSDEMNSHYEQLISHYQRAERSDNDKEKLQNYNNVVDCYDQLVLQEAIEATYTETLIKVFSSFKYILNRLTSKKNPKINDVTIVPSRETLIDVSGELMSSNSYDFNEEEIVFVLRQAVYTQLNPKRLTANFPDALLPMFAFADAYLSVVKPEKQELTLLCATNNALQKYIMSCYKNKNLTCANEFYLKSAAFEYLIIKMAIAKPSCPDNVKTIWLGYLDIAQINIAKNNYQHAYVNMAHFFLYYKYISSTSTGKFNNEDNTYILIIYNQCMANINELKDKNNEDKLYLQKIICHPGWLSLEKHPTTVNDLPILSEYFKDIVAHYLSTDDVKTALAYFSLSLDIYNAIVVKPKVNYSQHQTAIKSACKHYLTMIDKLMEKLEKNESLKQPLAQCKTKLNQVLNPTAMKAKKKKYGKKRKGNNNRMQAIRNLNAPLQSFLNQTNQAENNQALRDASAADIISCGEQGEAHHALLQAIEFCLNTNKPEGDKQKRAHIIKQKKLMTSYSGPYDDVISKNHQEALADLTKVNPKTQAKQHENIKTSTKNKKSSKKINPSKQQQTDASKEKSKHTNKKSNQNKNTSHKGNVPSNKKNGDPQLGHVNNKKKERWTAPFAGLKMVAVHQSKSKKIVPQTQTKTKLIEKTQQNTTITPEQKPTYAAIQIQLEQTMKNKSSEQTPQKTTDIAKESVHATIQTKTEIPSQSKSNPTKQQPLSPRCEAMPPINTLIVSLSNTLNPTAQKQSPTPQKKLKPPVGETRQTVFANTQRSQTQVPTNRSPVLNAMADDPFCNDIFQIMGGGPPQLILAELAGLYTRLGFLDAPIRATHSLFLVVKYIIHDLVIRKRRVNLTIVGQNDLTLKYLNLKQFTYSLPSSPKEKHESFDALKTHLKDSPCPSCLNFNATMNIDMIADPTLINYIHDLFARYQLRSAMTIHNGLHTQHGEQIVPDIFPQTTSTHTTPTYRG